ncbi:hypothetical protein PR048_015602 [Dryococelus australis]|uniref:Uncharacterized protein n=1 Tax=Dryococelus australis TaxID=614101 RepID=A0ABQ9HIF7_9NEOP|nr:hypothetical protein PR048_015602 [Dryococelus australis]
MCCFSCHALPTEPCRIENIQNKVTSGTSTPPQDKRGMHTVHLHAYSDETHKSTSHYRRLNSGGRLYLSADATIASYYEHYKNIFCKDISYKPVSADKYRQIFMEECNVGVKSPKNDTCKLIHIFAENLSFDVKAGDYIAYIYDSRWWLAEVRKVNESEVVCDVHFFHLAEQATSCVV